MRREDVIRKVMLEMHRHRMYDTRQESWIRGYLEMVYGAGFTEGRASRHIRKVVIKYDTFGNEVTRYDGLAEAAHHNKISKVSIRCAIKGRRHTAAGFLWKYGTEDVK